MKKIKSGFVLAALFALCATQADAQNYNFPGGRGPKNTEIGIGYTLGRAEYRFGYKDFNEQTNEFIDTSSVEKINSVFAYGGFVGYSWPVARMSESSRLYFTFNWMYNAIIWNNESSISYNASNNTYAETSDGATLQMGLPIGIDLKGGAEGNYDRSKRSTTTLGLGVFPSMETTVFREDAAVKFKLRPYIKGEVGVFLGIAMKLRAFYTLGNINYFKYDYSNGYSSSYTSFQGKSQLTLSLVFMPFSWKWGRSDW